MASASSPQGEDRSEISSGTRYADQSKFSNENEPEV